MRRESINYTLVGLVVLGALALLVVALFTITGRGGAATDYLVRYRNVTGLSYGAPVFYEGFRIGQVEAIDPERKDGKTTYRVKLNLRRDWPIPSDSVAKLASSGLLADVAIAIREGESKKMLAPGGELVGEENSDVFSALNELAGEITTLTRTKIRPLIEGLSTRVDSITATVDTQTPLVFDEAQTLLKRLNEAALQVQDVLGPQNRENVAVTLANIRGVTENLDKTRAQLDSLIANLDGIAAENRPMIRDAVRDLSQITSALARRIDAIANNLESSSRNFNEFTREVRKSPNRLLFTPEADDIIVEDEKK
ncbi:MAG TPA: MlaD family protein [Xanthomonadales bacterium]|nr:MlaD family protein [Xanthomonadales bacterium]